MPSNGPAEKIIYELKGIPLFTYGMIGITTLVLAYITFTDVEKSADNVENPLNKLNPLLQLPTAISNDVIASFPAIKFILSLRYKTIPLAEINSTR